ncbi:hypothetical protein [Klebsiella oxytoca]|uniref:hypothetical protein n=1 Tax=Klebsiella oxytoca TaxID=571 RepID=UPI001CCC1D94|nr:hypothetical protein [Klebsiella oxytoca]
MSYFVCLYLLLHLNLSLLIKIFNKENISFTLKNCKISAFEAQQAGLFGTTKDAWSCPDGITRYPPVKYRPEAGSSEKMQSELH